jgi:hypothetical protein
MKDDIQAIIDIMPRLEIRPTHNNVTIMCGIYNTLRDILKELEEEENAGSSAENGTKVDSDGRDNH